MSSKSKIKPRGPRLRDTPKHETKNTCWRRLPQPHSHNVTALPVFCGKKRVFSHAVEFRNQNPRSQAQGPDSRAQAPGSRAPGPKPQASGPKLRAPKSSARCLGPCKLSKIHRISMDPLRAAPNDFWGSDYRAREKATSFKNAPASSS